MKEYEENNKDRDNGDQGSDIERMLRAAGPREQPANDMKAAVRASVRGEWQEVVRQRARLRRQRFGLSLAAAVVLTVIGLSSAMLMSDPPSVVIATLSKSTGEVESKAGIWARRQVVYPRQPLRIGEDLITGANGRAAFALADGVSVRLDHDSRVSITEERRIVVLKGAVYVDAGAQPASGNTLLIDTPAGSVRHLGTQYEVRLTNSGVAVSVREGRVQLDLDEGDTQTARAGERLQISDSGTVQRGRLSPGDPAWEWAAAAAPAFEIDGRLLPDFLRWASREIGKEIVFASAAAEEQANTVILSGSVAGLSPEEAVAAVLPTAQLRAVDRGGQLVIEVAAEG